MLTRCPHCQTSFRVTSEQLKLRQGQVRCGECRGVFNALESLADEVATVVVTAEAVETATVESGATLDAEPAEPRPETEPGPADEAESAPEPEPEPELALGPESEAAEQEGAVAEAAPADEEESADELPPEEDWAPVEAPPRRWPWILGTLLLLFFLGGQLLYLYRVEIAVLTPELRPALVAACEMLGCEVSRPRKPELVGIESSDLAPEGRERLLLTAALKNRAPFDQEYPHLELTLTDAQDSAILRKVLAPADYLPAELATSDGFASHGEVAVKLLLEAKGVPAVGYRLYLFYP